MAGRFVTTLGCTITVADAPENLGAGVLLGLWMEQPGDGRNAEVYLSPSDVDELRVMLGCE